jgi:hypothetical protein
MVTNITYVVRAGRLHTYKGRKNQLDLAIFKPTRLISKKDNRKVEINHKLKDYKAVVNELLKSEIGIIIVKKELTM